MGSHQSGAEGQNRLPRPAGHAAFEAAQDTVVLLCVLCISTTFGITDIKGLRSKKTNILNKITKL